MDYTRSVSSVVFEPLKYNIPVARFSCRPEENFIRLCDQIINNNNNINIISCHNIIFTMANYYPEKMDEILRIIFERLSLEINNKIDKMYKEDILSIQDFIDMYYDYEERYNKLSHFLYTFDNLFYSEDHKYSRSKFIKNNAMYLNVICKSYTKGNKKSYIYSILNNILIDVDNIMDIKEVNELYKIFNLFDKRKLIYNIKCEDVPENMFLNEVSKSLNNLIHTLIVEYSHIDDEVMKKDINNDLNTLLSNININYCNPELFCHYYEYYFEKRLYSKYFLSELELKLINNLTHKNFGYLRDNITIKLGDFYENQIFHIVIHKDPFIITNIRSNKEFENIINPGDSVNLNIMTPFVYRNILLNSKTPQHKSQYDNMNIPLNIKLYYHIYKQLYQNWYPKRHFTWDYKKGSSIIQMTLNNKDYQFKVSFPQLYLIYQFNKDNNISAVELSKRLNISLKELGGILNIFLTNKILVRDQNFKSNDPKVIIAINDHFYSCEDKISLI